MRRSSSIWLTLAALCVLWAGPAQAIFILDFETEDDFVTGLVNGQHVNTVAEVGDSKEEFGNLVDISSTVIGNDGHLGVAVFDSDTGDANDGGVDPDLIVDLGNILILQNDDSSASTDNATDGKVFTTPNDEASFEDRGSIFFEFVSPVSLISLDLVDINGGVEVEVTLTDGGGDTRVYSVPSMWTTDPTVNPNGWQTLDLTTLAAQAAEPNATGGDATAAEFGSFDPTDVVSLDVAFGGSSPSGGLDNLIFTPEPGTALLLACGLAGFAASRRRALR